jgi:hypothetical protein
MKKLILIAVAALLLGSCEKFENEQQPEPIRTGTLLCWTSVQSHIVELHIDTLNIHVYPISSLYAPDCMSNWRWRYEIPEGTYDVYVIRMGSRIEKTIKIDAGFCTVVDVFRTSTW